MKNNVRGIIRDIRVHISCRAYDNIFCAICSAYLVNHQVYKGGRMKPYYAGYTPIVKHGVIVAYVFEVKEKE